MITNQAAFRDRLLVRADSDTPVNNLAAAFENSRVITSDEYMLGMPNPPGTDITIARIGTSLTLRREQQELQQRSNTVLRALSDTTFQLLTSEVEITDLNNAGILDIS